MSAHKSEDVKPWVGSASFLTTSHNYNEKLGSLTIPFTYYTQPVPKSKQLFFQIVFWINLLPPPVKVVLKILQVRLQQYVNHKLSEV